MQDDRNSLERLIDDVAREITAAPVDEGFARRVSARVHDAEAARAPRTWLRVWVLVPAAAAVLVLAVLIVRERQSPSSVQQTASAPAIKTTDAAKEVATGDVRPTTSAKATGVAKPDATAGAATTNVRLAPRVALFPRGPSGAADLEPLAVAPIETAALDLSPLVVAMPIEISTIAIDRIEISAMP